MPRRTMFTPAELAIARNYGRLRGFDAAIDIVNDYLTVMCHVLPDFVAHDLNVLLRAAKEHPAAVKSVTTNALTGSTIKPSP